MNWYGFNMPQFVSQSFEQPIDLFVKRHWKTSLTWSGWWSRFVFLSVAGRHAPPFVSFYFFFFPFCDPIYSHLPGQVDMTVNRFFCRPHFFAEMRWQTPPVCHLASVAKQHLKGRKLAAAAPRTRGEQKEIIQELQSWVSDLDGSSKTTDIFRGGDKLCEEIVDKNNHNIFYKAWRNSNVGWNYTVIYTERKEWRRTAEWCLNSAFVVFYTSNYHIHKGCAHTGWCHGHNNKSVFASRNDRRCTPLEGDVWNCFVFLLLSLSLCLSRPHLKA